jgi:hypothetical protein
MHDKIDERTFAGAPRSGDRNYQPARRVKHREFSGDYLGELISLKAIVSRVDDRIVVEVHRQLRF